MPMPTQSERSRRGEHNILEAAAVFLSNKQTNERRRRVIKQERESYRLALSFLILSATSGSRRGATGDGGRVEAMLLTSAADAVDLRELCFFGDGIDLENNNPQSSL